MKTHCIVCNKEFIPDEEDAKRIVNTVDKHSLGTTAILDMLTPLAGMCDTNTKEYHVLDFDNEERNELHRLGLLHKDSTSKLKDVLVKYQSVSEDINKLKTKLQELIKNQEDTKISIEQEDKNIESVINRCEEITYSKRIDLWQVTEKQTDVEQPKSIVT